MQNQPNPGAIGVRKPRLSYSNGVASTKKVNGERTLERKKTFLLFLARKAAAGREPQPADGASLPGLTPERGPQDRGVCWVAFGER